MMENKGMSPRKAMASGPGGSFGVGKFPSAGTSVTHVSPETGTGMAMKDGERGAKPTLGGPIGKQAAPDHGPVKDHFKRAERTAY